MKKAAVLIVILLSLVGSGIGGWWLGQQVRDTDQTFLSPLIKETPKPLLAYTIPALSQRQYQSSKIQIEKVLTTTPDYISYQFSYMTLNKKMTGQLNLPVNASESAQTSEPVPTIIMLRGYVPPEIFTTGVGTKNVAAVLASQGFITVAPDFFSYGDSDKEPIDSWQARFEKPITVIELLRTLQAQPVSIDGRDFRIGNLGIWAHSNGGQIALTTLEILNEKIPTTLWSPVTAPFPYSILFFSDENADEGKEMRRWLATFEKNYNIFDFSLTQHLDRLAGPLQLHHGTTDEAALKVWSDEFVTKINLENKKRELQEKRVSTGAATLKSGENLEPIAITYFTYPGADHNLQPGWNTVVERDLKFFTDHLK